MAKKPALDVSFFGKSKLDFKDEPGVKRGLHSLAIAVRLRIHQAVLLALSDREGVAEFNRETESSCPIQTGD
jgi:hypothetical protein